MGNHRRIGLLLIYVETKACELLGDIVASKGKIHLGTILGNLTEVLSLLPNASLSCFNFSPVTLMLFTKQVIKYSLNEFRSSDQNFP